MNPAHLAVYDGPTGSLEGTVRIDGPPAPAKTGVDFSACPDAEKMYGKLFREGPPEPDGPKVIGSGPTPGSP